MSGPVSTTFTLARRTRLNDGEQSAMFQLLSHHFDGVTPEQFTRDLAEKDLALLIRQEGALVGFSTLMCYSTQFEGEPVNVIYSGDTIVAPEAWGTMALPRAWVAGVHALQQTLPPARCFWLLLTSGFRTYRFLPVFWREFHPRFDAPTPRAASRLLHQLARGRFGPQFDADAGIVRFNRPQQLRAGLGKVPAEREHDPHVAFFLSRNPGHARGDELVCLTEISHGNLTRAGRKMMPLPHELAGHIG
jgi:hypothetical protein